VESRDRFPEVSIVLPMFLGVACFFGLHAIEPVNFHGASGMGLVLLMGLLLVSWLWQAGACFRALLVLARVPNSRRTTNKLFTALGALYLIAVVYAAWKWG
jgi:hypothetical protein